MFVHNYEALLAGDLKGENLTHEDFIQVNQDDLEEVDLNWKIAMLTVHASRFMEKTRRNKFASMTIDFDNITLRCYNCEQLGHFKKESPMHVDNII
ncbi:putative transcription factor interactor and regulator CCHC(Zn) family [Helianthus anomalus]